MISHLGVSRARLALILGALAMLGPFSIDTVFPAFAVMQTELGVDKVAMQQTISFYLLGYAAMSLFHGPLSDALGRVCRLIRTASEVAQATLWMTSSATRPRVSYGRARLRFSAV